MIKTHFKNTVLMLIILISTLFSTVVFAECDMMAMIAKKGNHISWINGSESSWQIPNDPHDYFSFLDNFSPDNPDGYGIVYIDSDGNIPEIDYPSTIGYPTEFYDVSDQAWYVIPNTTSGTYTIGLYDDPYEDAKSEILESSNEVGIVMGHVRDASGTTIGNHPFQLICDTNDDGIDETYMFMHNGNVTDMVSTFRSQIYSIDNSWFTTYPSNWFGSPSNTSGWIDSEMYLHYIVAHIKEADGNIMKGIYNALSNVTADYQTGVSINEGMLDNNVNANFVLSDGENLYLYRNCDDNDHRLAYDEHDNGFFGVQTNNSMSQFTQLSQNSFAIISQYGDPVVMNNFLMDDDYHTNPSYIAQKTFYEYNFISGEIDNNTTDLNIHYTNTYISGDTYIESGHTLDLDSEVVSTYTFDPEIKFAGNHNLYIEGTLNVNEDASLNLSNSSLVEISGSGELFLDWGSTITGSTPTTVEATPPGQPVGGEPLISGDRIIAKNGGIITTSDKDDFISDPGDPITISSSMGEQWDGIFIQNPGDEDDFWFVNCDISGIGKISIEDVGWSANNIANLKLYRTDFHDAGQIVIRDGHTLSVEGTSNDLCYFEDTPAYPIYAYESPIDLNYVHIEDNGGGIYAYDSSTPLSVINNCNILENGGDGVKLNGVAFSNFNDNNIEDNTGFGMLSYPGTIFDSDDFNDNTLSDNGYAEYAGWQATFYMSNSSANITIEDSNYGSGSDQYLLMDILWDETNAVDISGTNLTSSDLSHLSPSDPDAWVFSREKTSENEMLYSASSNMGNGNYTLAEDTLHELISDYPSSTEAGSAIYYLYHLETLTDQDYSALREYLEDITPPNNSSLEMAIKKIITKTYMKDKDYLIAIELLETVIANSQIPDEVISAMIDEGYCYLELADEGERGLPVNCTVRTATLDEYQAKVRELESQFSFYPEENNQDTTPVAGDIISISNYPNPFNPSTTISFNLSAETNVSIAVYNIKGQKVKQLMNDDLSVGQHSIEWNGKDTNNKSVSSGIYFYKISAGKSSAMRKMLLLK